MGTLDFGISETFRVWLGTDAYVGTETFFLKIDGCEPSQELWWRPWRCRGHCGLDYLGPGSKIRRDFFEEGILGSGGFRRVRSGVRIRKLLTRASGMLLASRLGRDEIWDFGR